jgi:predicted component of type VI protein secretion system
MAEESLRELLARLHQQLGASGRTVDGEARQLLMTVMRDIERALEPAGQGGEDGGPAAAAHTPRLESLAVRFEAGHPGLAEALRELIDALVKAGI